MSVRWPAEPLSLWVWLLLCIDPESNQIGALQRWVLIFKRPQGKRVNEWKSRKKISSSAAVLALLLEIPAAYVGCSFYPWSFVFSTLLKLLMWMLSIFFQSRAMGLCDCCTSRENRELKPPNLLIPLTRSALFLFLIFGVKKRVINPVKIPESGVEVSGGPALIEIDSIKRRSAEASQLTDISSMD